MKVSLEEALIVENSKTVLLGSERLCRSEHSQTQTAAGGFRVRGERDSRAGTEPPDQIPMGTNGTGWQKKVMQFLNQGRYVANVVDGKVMFY